MWDTTSIADGRQDSRGFLDGSGWTVSTGNATRATGATQTRPADPFGGSSPALGQVSMAGLGGSLGGLSINPTMLMIAGGAVLLVVLLKRKKG